MFIKNVRQAIESTEHQEVKVLLKIKIICKIVICNSQSIPKFGHSFNFPILPYVFFLILTFCVCVCVDKLHKEPNF